MSIRGERLPHQITKFVSKHTGSRNTNCPLPVRVVVALIVGELPESVLGESSVISDDKEFGAGDSSTGDILGDEEELEVVGDDIVGDDGSWQGILLPVKEKPIIDPLVNRDLRELWLVVLAELPESLLDLGDFNVHDQLDLRLTNSISVENNEFWQAFIHTLVLFQSLFHKFPDAVDDFLPHVLDMRDRDVLGEEAVHGGTEADDTFLHLPGIVEDISTNQHRVFWQTFRALNFPELVSSLGSNLLEDIG